MLHQDTLEFSAALVLGAALGAIAALTLNGPQPSNRRSWVSFFRR